MAHIDLTRAHTLDADEGRWAAKQLARYLEEKFASRCFWEGDVLKFDSSSGMTRGMTGRITLTSTEVRLEIDLPLSLHPMKDKFETTLREQIDLIFG